MAEIDHQLVRTIIERVTSVSAPDRIILFGSAARGDMNRDSDIDLLVLRSGSFNIREERKKIRDALFGFEYPIDLILMQTEQFERSKHVVGGIAYPANGQGVLIYESH